MNGRVLIVAGSDSGGGAGIQADIKTVTALGGYAMTAVTALTAQNTLGVFGIHEVPPDFVVQQMRLALSDIGADCVKIGMLHRPEIIAAVVEILGTDAVDVPVVIDPVMMAKGGHALLTPDSMAMLRDRLIPMARVLTPNLPEAEALAGVEKTDRAGSDIAGLASRLLALGPHAVLVKGGHAPGPIVVDVLAEAGGETEIFTSPRIDTSHTHGTGCTLASAVATGLAQGMTIREAVIRARAYVWEAIRTAPGLGRGRGPLNHACTVRPFTINL